MKPDKETQVYLRSRMWERSIERQKKLNRAQWIDAILAGLCATITIPLFSLLLWGLSL